MFDQEKTTIAIKTMGSVTMVSASGQSCDNVGQLLQHQDGSYELSLAVVPSASSYLRFQLPDDAPSLKSHAPIQAIIGDSLEGLILQIGEVEATGSSVKATFWGTPAADDRIFLNLQAEQCCDAGDLLDGPPETSATNLGKEPIVIAVAKFSKDMVSSLQTLVGGMSDEEVAEIEVTDRGLWFAHPCGPRIFLGSTDQIAETHHFNRNTPG